MIIPYSEIHEILTLILIMQRCQITKRKGSLWEGHVGCVGGSAGGS